MKNLWLFLVFSVVIIVSVSSDFTYSQEVYFCKNYCANGEPNGESSTFQYDVYIDNVIYILVKFPSAYGKNKIHFRHEKVGEPGPVAFVEIDPSSTWICYEMNIPQWGEYTITVTDADNNLIRKDKIVMLQPKL